MAAAAGAERGLVAGGLPSLFSLEVGLLRSGGVVGAADASCRLTAAGREGGDGGGGARLPTGEVIEEDVAVVDPPHGPPPMDPTEEDVAVAAALRSLPGLRAALVKASRGYDGIPAATPSCCC